ncbi:MAG TPA: hypothetical protein GX503_07085 [Clostridiales bacterium]|nr:hypothetical protein [Clostridiales bacterium]
MEETVNKNSLTGKEVLRYFAAIAPYINLITTVDLGISVIEGDTYLAYTPAKNLDLGLKAGDKLKPGILADRAMKEKRTLVHEYTLEDSPFGVPYIACCYPVLDEKQKKAIGCIATTQSTESQEFIRQASANLSAAAQQLASSIQSMTSQIQQLASSASEQNKQTEAAFEEMKNIHKITAFIKHIANQTNLLGLNASIEAAHIGNMGNGFMVVANEIRKLSQDSAQSVQQITETLQTIAASMEHINQQSHYIHSLADKHLAVIQEIAATSQELSATAQELQVFTHIIQRTE